MTMKANQPSNTVGDINAYAGRSVEGLVDREEMAGVVVKGEYGAGGHGVRPPSSSAPMAGPGGALGVTGSSPKRMVNPRSLRATAARRRNASRRRLWPGCLPLASSLLKRSSISRRDDLMRTRGESGVPAARAYRSRKAILSSDMAKRAGLRSLYSMTAAVSFLHDHRPACQAVYAERFGSRDSGFDARSRSSRFWRSATSLPHSRWVESKRHERSLPVAAIRFWPGLVLGDFRCYIRPGHWDRLGRFEFA